MIVTRLQSSRKLGTSLSVGWKLARSGWTSSSANNGPSASSRESALYLLIMYFKVTLRNTLEEINKINKFSTCIKPNWHLGSSLHGGSHDRGWREPLHMDHRHSKSVRYDSSNLSLIPSSLQRPAHTKLREESHCVNFNMPFY